MTALANCTASQRAKLRLPGKLNPAVQELLSPERSSSLQEGMAHPLHRQRINAIYKHTHYKNALNKQTSLLLPIIAHTTCPMHSIKSAFIRFFHSNLRPCKTVTTLVATGTACVCVHDGSSHVSTCSALQTSRKARNTPLCNSAKPRLCLFFFACLQTDRQISLGIVHV